MNSCLLCSPTLSPCGKFKPKHWYVKYGYLELGSPQIPSYMGLPVFELVVQIPLQGTERHFWTAIHPEGDALKPAENPPVSTDLDTYAGAKQ